MKGTKTILSIALMLCVSLLMGQRELPNETKKEISVNKTEMILSCQDYVNGKRKSGGHMPIFIDKKGDV